MNIGLTARVAVAMVALAIATAAVVACVAYVNLERAALPAELGRLDAHVRQLASRLQDHVAGSRVALLGLLNAPRFDGYVRAATNDGVDPHTGTGIAAWRKLIVDAFRRRLARSESFVQLRLIDVADPGMELIRVDRLGPGGAVRTVPQEGLQPKGHREFVAAASRLGPDEVYVSGIDLNRESGSVDSQPLPTLRIAAPVYDSIGVLFAVAVVNVNMGPALSRIRAETMAAGDVYVLNEQGAYLVRPEQERELGSLPGPTEAQVPPLLQRFLGGDDLSARVMQLEDDRVGIAGVRVRPAGGPAVTVLETVPYLDLIGPVAVLARSTLLGTVIASLAALVVAVLFARTLIRPLVQMTRAVGSGADDHATVRAPVEAAGEIGVLARAFETMRDEVRTKRQALTHQVEERHQAEERFRMAVEASPNGMLIVNAAGLITMANAGASRMFGYSREALEGNDVEMLVPERFRASHTPWRREYFAAATTRLMGQGRELYARREDGTEFPVEVALNPIDTREEAQVLAVVADVTARKAAESRLRRHQEQLEQLLAANPDAMLVVSRDGVVHYANDAALSLFERTRDQLLGNRFGFALPEDDTSEVEIPRSDGRRKVAMQVVGIEWEGQPAHLASLRDVTVERRLNDQLRQAQKMEAIGRLAGGISHDFNNLLTVIIGYATELRERDLGAAERADLDQVLGAAERASGLSRQLLLHARSSPAAPEPVSLTKVVGGLEPMLRRLIGADVELAVNGAEDLWAASLDTGQIEQVILNLVVNARDAMPDGGHLVIETSNLALEEEYAATFVELDAGDYVMLTVSDTGCGMDATTQQRIFEPFFTTKEDKGTGLGLATSYGVIKQAGGHVSVYSEVGVGTTFKVYLPRCDVAAAEPVAAPPEPAPADGAGTILLVEDNDGVRMLSRRVLEANGFEVLEAADGRAGLSVANDCSDDIDLLLTDMVMPGLSGVELAAQVKDRHPRTLVLYMSGYTGDTMIRSSRIPLHAHYIEKPFTPAQLVRRVRAVLGGDPRDGGPIQ